MISKDAQQALAKVCAILNKHEVNYIVVGGSAVNFYGYVRHSSISSYKPEIKYDLDFWYNPTVENFHKILAALDELNVDTSDLKNIVFDRKNTFLKFLTTFSIQIFFAG